MSTAVAKPDQGLVDPENGDCSDFRVPGERCRCPPIRIPRRGRYIHITSRSMLCPIIGGKRVKSHPVQSCIQEYHHYNSSGIIHRQSLNGKPVRETIKDERDTRLDPMYRQPSKDVHTHDQKCVHTGVWRVVWRHYWDTWRRETHSLYWMPRRDETAMCRYLQPPWCCVLGGEIQAHGRGWRCVYDVGIVLSWRIEEYWHWWR